MIWLALGALTVLVAGLLVRPLWWRARRRAPGAAPEVAFYRDQLAEIERDVALGALTAEQAGAARLEVQRRLLAAAPTLERPQPAPGLAWGPRLGLALPLVAILAAGALGLYLELGSPDAVHVAAAPHPESGDPKEFVRLVEQLQAKLKDNPRDIDGWILLARSLRTLDRLPEAAEAFMRALALSGGSPEIAAAYGELLIEIAQGTVTPEALDLFHQALARDPTEPRARFYVGLAKAQSGDTKAAIDDWSAMLRDAPPDAPYIAAVRQQIAETAQSAGLPAPAIASGPPPAESGPSPQGGPSAADMAAAANMSPEDRQKMIRGMVDGLAARLKTQPDDVGGWLRLARAYSVLGEPDRAKDALDQAAQHTPPDAPNAADVRAQIAAFAESAGLPSPVPAPAAPPSASTPRGSTPPGPSAADMAAAANMSPEQRQQMIHGMVDGLAARLKDNPKDVDGWLRLARAYDVLGEPGRAKDALAQAAQQAPARIDVLTAYAQALYTPEKAADKPPPEYVAVMRRILALEPTNAQAMWFVA
ncbi:MAG TPA: c-type cytochrome biogenesis protein CcmI, partial [Candidatus Sulfotelmatobacter sp.]|nr:c-type cytochrome biogenesis protein CcmI [Candidatus Sulfotelmatobacter sp.]